MDSNYWQLSIPVISVVLGWLLNESGKRSWERYQRKEDRYRELLLNLKGFYKSRQDEELKQKFIDQVYLCWLYSPDHVIQKSYIFLDDCKSSGNDAEKSAGALLVAIRKDIMPWSWKWHWRFWRTSDLTAEDFKHYSPKSGTQ